MFKGSEQGYEQLLSSIMGNTRINLLNGEGPVLNGIGLLFLHGEEEECSGYPSYVHAKGVKSGSRQRKPTL